MEFKRCLSKPFWSYHKRQFFYLTVPKARGYDRKMSQTQTTDKRTVSYGGDTQYKHPHSGKHIIKVKRPDIPPSPAGRDECQTSKVIKHYDSHTPDRDFRCFHPCEIFLSHISTHTRSSDPYVSLLSEKICPTSLPMWDNHTNTR